MAKTGLYEKAKGRSRYDRSVRLYEWIWPALMERLRGNELKVLVYLMTFEKGTNNGDLFMGARIAAEGTGLDPKTAHKCLVNLDRQGFIRPIELGWFTRKGGPATKWRLTFIPCDGKAPTHEWRLPPSEKKSWLENFPAAVGEIPRMNGEHRATVGEIPTVETETAESLVGNIGTHTVAIAGDEAGPAQRPIPSPSNASGPNGADEAALAARQKIARYFYDLKPPKQRAFAEMHSVQAEDVKAYILRDPFHLPAAKIAAMLLAIRTAERKKRERRVARKQPAATAGAGG